MVRRTMIPAAAALLLWSGAAHAAPACSAEAVRTLPEVAAATLAAVDAAARLVAGGRADEADAPLAEVERRAPVLQASLDCLAARLAPVERQCSAAVLQLEERMSDLRTQERALDGSLARLRETLAAARSQQSSNQAELDRRRAAAAEAARQLAELRERQRELETWWWVPGYGQYLAIRTLADNDVGRQRTAIDELAAAEQSAADLQTALRGHARTVLSTANEAQCTARFQTSLETARGEAMADLGRARAARVFLARAGSFAADARRLATATGVQQADLARTLIAFMASEGPEAALGLDGQVGSMAAGLQAFARMLAERPDYLAADTVSCDFDTANPDGGSRLRTAPDGLLLKTADAPTIWFIDGTRRRALPDMRTLGALGLGAAGYLLVSAPTLAGFPEGPPIPTVDAPPEAIVRNAAGTHYLLQDGRLRAIPTAETFEALDLRWNEAVLLDDATIAALPAGPAFPALPAPPEARAQLAQNPVLNAIPKLLAATAAAAPAVGVQASGAEPGRLIRDPADGGTYWLQRGRRLHIPDTDTFQALGFHWDEVANLPGATIAAIPDSCPTQLVR